MGKVSIELRSIPVDIYTTRSSVGEANFEVSFSAKPFQRTLITLKIWLENVKASLVMILKRKKGEHQ